MQKVWCVVDDKLKDNEVDELSDNETREIHKLNGCIGEVDITECGLDSFIYFHMTRKLNVTVNDKVYRIGKSGLKNFWIT